MSAVLTAWGAPMGVVGPCEPRSRPRGGSGTHPVPDAAAAPQRPVQSEGAPDA